ncbi:MAG: prenyltransferase/squalene oxidase repeat-containing protein [Planctomycetota bacterium]
MLGALVLGALALTSTTDDDERDVRVLARLQDATLPEAEYSTPASQHALAAGLAFLATAQAKAGDGSFSVGDVERQNYAPLGVSALATLAFLADGNAPGRGPHGSVVEQALEYLLRQTDLAPESNKRGFISVQGDGLSRTHGHGFATLALAEIYGMSSGSERVRAALVAAVERIQTSQGSEGGWEYEPRAVPAHEGSVTVCLVQALRAARDAGISIDVEVVRRAEDYVRRLQAPNGLFCYTLGDERRASSALAAAAITTLNAAGRYDDSLILGTVDAIWSDLALQEERGRTSFCPEYERLYLAQAFWQIADTSHFRRWYGAERDRLLRTQESDGSWRGSRFGAVYATAVNCLVLAIPDSDLPIFQR